MARFFLLLSTFLFSMAIVMGYGAASFADDYYTYFAGTCNGCICECQYNPNHGTCDPTPGRPNCHSDDPLTCGPSCTCKPNGAQHCVCN